MNKIKNLEEPLNLGCSSIKLTSNTNNTYWFRTCDMNDSSNVWNAGSKVISFKKGYKFNFSNKIDVIAKYSILGVSYGNCYNRLLDGINEEGLTGGLLYYVEGTSLCLLRNHVDYTEKLPIEGMEILTYFLSNCANVKEVIELSSKIVVSNVIHNNFSIPATMHYTLLDKDGNCIVLEADKSGDFSVYTNTIGVLTNSPSYSEHLENLSFFIGTSKELQNGRLNQKPIINKFLLDGVEVLGSNSNNKYLRSDVLPGSFTSVDRFIRLATLKHLVNCGKNFSDEEMLLKGTELMSTVIVPRHQGYFYYNYWLMEEKQNVTSDDHSLNGNIMFGGGDDYTQYIIMYNLDKKSLYIKSDKSLVFNNFNLKNIKSGLTIYDINNDVTKGVIYS